MLSSKIKDVKLRIAYNKAEKKRKINKFLFTNLSNSKLNELEKIKTAFPLVVNFSRNSSKIRLTRRCVLNNRNRGVLRDFGISRVKLREMMSFGVVPGYSKAVW